MCTLVFGLGTAQHRSGIVPGRALVTLWVLRIHPGTITCKASTLPAIPSLALGVSFEAPNLGPFSSCTGFQAPLSAAVLAGTLGCSPASPLALMLPRARLPGSAKNP